MVFKVVSRRLTTWCAGSSLTTCSSEWGLMLNEGLDQCLLTIDIHICACKWESYKKVFNVKGDSTGRSNCPIFVSHYGWRFTWDYSYAVEKNIFKEFNISGSGQDTGISHIQYVDDTILVGEMSLSNVRALKCILKNFELVAGLKVNFHKSRLIGLKSNWGTIEHAAGILNYKVGALPFKFLGV